MIAPFSRIYDRQIAVDFLETEIYIDDAAILYKKPDTDEYVITIFYSVSWHCMSVITMFWYLTGIMHMWYCVLLVLGKFRPGQFPPDCCPPPVSPWSIPLSGQFPPRSTTLWIIAPWTVALHAFFPQGRFPPSPTPHTHAHKINSWSYFKWEHKLTLMYSTFY